MSTNLFKYKQFKSEIILLSVRWYLKYPLSYRNLLEMLSERGVFVNYTTIMRWVHEYAPIIDEKVRPYLRKCNDSWRVDETYIKVKGVWSYLYRAVDSGGKTIDFYLSKTRDRKSAKKFFEKAMKSLHSTSPRVITVDKNQAYKSAFPELINENVLDKRTKLRQVKYLNNIVEQDHRFIKKKVKYMLGFKSFNSAVKTIAGVEAMNMLRKGQVDFKYQSVLNEFQFVSKIMGVAK